ncbi:alpha-amylase family protein [filamentous cyanobacterium LEGE 11480]|uniref:Alpha-amylase n=1 Tax=Romeriopsis navalis LEGE 11480 TaxID=2777977 RepID=A0A928Z3W8_9CYAN|nr:alpha-amylase family protein [Romeriopsis navalis]MBE9030437.1 alpha-amylase family protein [Romeriopsis navalis LEGE 11480]
MQKLKLLICATITFIFVTISSYMAFPMPSARADVILHAFDWSYQDIADNAEGISAAGYKAVLVTPPLKSQKSSCEWFQRYQPQDFRVVDNCDGNKESFINAIEALDREGVQTYADVVVNHMANERDGATTFPGSDTLQEYDDYNNYWKNQILYGDTDGNGILDNGFLPDDGKSDGLFDSNDFHDAKCISDYNNRDAVIFDRLCKGENDRGLPDLKDSEPGKNWVNDQRKQYIQALYNLGVRGFRIDAAKHMPLGAIEYFVPDQVAKNSQMFAEIITSGGTTDLEYQLFLKPYLSQLPEEFGAYDFPLLKAIKNAFAFGKPLSDVANPYATGNALENTRAVTVVVTHDIPYNDIFRNNIFDPKDEDLAYAYIMGRDGGTPLVFDDGSAGQSDGGRWVGVWKKDMMKRMIDFHNHMQGKPMEVLAADECALLWRRDEDGIVGINKCVDERSLTVDTSFKLKWNYPYTDILTGNLLPEIQGPSYTFKLPARSASMWLD